MTIWNPLETVADVFPVISATHARRANLAAAYFWFFMLPTAIITGWIYSVAFISAVSIYANFVSHLSAWQAARAEEAGEQQR